MKKNLVLMFGGKSAEHDVSLRSAKTIYKHLDKELYDIYLVGITRKGLWYQQDPSIFDSDTVLINPIQAVSLVNMEGQTRLVNFTIDNHPPIDVVFPITHGPNGEDGTLQGFFTVLNLPFVGPDTLGGACAMDKEVAKILLQAYGLNVAPGLVIHHHQHLKNPFSYNYLASQLGQILYVKPANMGSSVGVNRVENQEQLEIALKEAFKFDHKILVEKAIVGREIECAVMGNKEEIKASAIGEILPKTFYTYEAKYLNNDEAGLAIPADLDEQTVKKVQQMAVRAYQALQCEGMTRVDFFLQADGKIVVNEANALPGFTNISMYPSLWAESGLPLPQLLNQLIDLAFQRFNRNANLQRSLKVEN